MKLKIGETIKSLRLQHLITQEELADAIGVSFQSISRWELGVCYPDMELLPSISQYFDISVDELIGMPDIRSEERKRSIFTAALDLERAGQWSEAIDVLREGLQTYPKDNGLLSELALALSKTGVPEDCEEAILLSERVLRYSTDEKLRSTTRANLAFLYKAVGQQQKAEEIGRSLPHIWECREILMPDLVPAEKRAAEAARSMDIAQQVLRDVTEGNPVLFSLGYRPMDI